MDLEADHRQVDDRSLASREGIARPGVARRGIDRRTLIKRAAVAGAVAWTVPVVLDSLASPAAAATCGVIYRVEIQMDTSCIGKDAAGTIAVGSFAADDCYPDATGGAITIPPALLPTTVVNVAGGVSAVGASVECVVLTPSGTNTVKLNANVAAPAASCDSRLNNNVIATIASPCTPTTKSLSTCSGTKTFIAAGYNWRTSDCGNFARQWEVGGSVSTADSCDEASPTNCNGRGSDGGTNSGTGYATRTIVSASSTAIEFNQPASDKGPDHSGSYQFVIGCGCV